VKGYLGVMWIVAAREYRHRVWARSFLFSTIATPLLLVGVLGLTAYAGIRERNADTRAIALVDRSGLLAEAVQAALEGGGFQVEIAATGSTEEVGLAERLRDHSLRAVLILGPETIKGGQAVLRTADPPSAPRTLALEEAVRQAVVSVRVQQLEDATSLTTLLAGGGVRVEHFGEFEADEEGAGVLGREIGFVGAFLLYAMLLIYGATLLRTVHEEKIGRISEVILASVRPSQLMMGKIVGVGAVGLTQVGSWFLLGLAAVDLGLPFLMQVLPEVIPSLDVTRFMPSAGVFFFFFLCFVLGYFLYASIFAAVGSIVSSEQEVHHFQAPLMILFVVPIVLLMPTLNDPSASWVVAMSLFPIFSPILMFARVAVGAASAWQAAISVALMLGTLLGVATGAGRVYRAGMLMHGKRTTLTEIWLWMRGG